MKTEGADVQGQNRKYRLAIISIAMMTIVGLLALEFPSFAPLYSEFVTGIIGINLVYNGGNVGAKWAISKVTKNIKK